MQLTEQQQARWTAAQAFLTASMPPKDIIERLLFALADKRASSRQVPDQKDYNC